MKEKTTEKREVIDGQLPRTCHGNSYYNLNHMMEHYKVLAQGKKTNDHMNITD